MDRKKFENKVVVVTGASAGLGKAIAMAFAKCGAKVSLIARNQARLNRVRKEIESYGSKALMFPCDVADAKALEKSAEETESKLGPIDIWVNNAMVTVFSPVRQMQPEEYERVTQVTYLGTVYGTLAALKAMMKRNVGTIIQVGSVLAYRGIPLQSAYCAAKHAIEGFCDSLRAELLHDQSAINVSMVQMPALNTPQFDWVKSRMTHKAQPVAPIFQPEVGAKAVLWVAAHPRRELNVSFRSSLFIWGNKFFPGFGDWYLSKTGFQGQQTQELENPKRPNNLFESVDGDYGSHGRFDSQSIPESRFLWFQTHVPLWGVYGVFILLVLIWLIRKIYLQS